MIMLRTRSLVVSFVAAAAAGCASDVVVQSPPVTAGVRVINATSGPLDVLVDGQVMASAVPLASVSSTLQLTPGSHQLQLRSVSGAISNLSVQTTDGDVVTAAAYPGNTSALDASVLVDTGAVVPSGTTKLRVVHLAASAGNIEIWRSQPDFQTPVHIMTPFPYQATSPYLESTPGDWEVFVTPIGSSTKLATTGQISIPSGERRTAVLLDSAGVLRFRVISE